jgi:hypothetical protein
MVMDVVAAVKTKMMGEKDGPSRAMLRSILLSVLHVLDLWASRHDLLVIPKVGITSGSNMGTCAHRRAHENLNISGITGRPAQSR